MLNDVEMNEVGIREGEKLHEVMVTRDDARNTYEYEKHYIIYPHFDWWNAKQFMSPGGKQIEAGFEYNSGNNAEWLSIEDLREKMIKLNLFDYRKHN